MRRTTPHGGQKEPSPGARQAPLSEVAGPHRSDRTVRHSARDTPVSVAPTLRGDDGVEGTTVSYLLSAALTRMKKEKEEDARRVEKERVKARRRRRGK